MSRSRLCMTLAGLLGAASVAQAGAVIELQVSDTGTVDADGNVVGWTDLPAPVEVEHGEQFLVHVWMTVDTPLTSGARLLQVDHTGPLTTVPFGWLGTDIDTINQPIDGIPNFWFDYTQATFSGRFPVRGVPECPGLECPSPTGEYSDFSNLGGPPGPSPAVTVFAPSTPGAQMFQFVPGEPLHVGAMVVTIPMDALLDSYALDLLNAYAPDDNWGAGLEFDFENPTKWSVVGGDVAYAEGAGPAEFTVIPEPVTLLLLGLGGLMAIRRRRC